MKDNKENIIQALSKYLIKKGATICPDCKGSGLKPIGDKLMIPKCRTCYGNGFVLMENSDKT
jgi:DnaJ-class molecular chaperone